MEVRQGEFFRLNLLQEIYMGRGILSKDGIVWNKVIFSAIRYQKMYFLQIILNHKPTIHISQEFPQAVACTNSKQHTIKNVNNIICIIEIYFLCGF